jgi:RNA polymerase sigma factor (sigma-70 family)
MTLGDRREGARHDSATEEASPFAALIAQVHAGSQSAARTLYENHSEAVLAVIRDLLEPQDPLRRRVDSTDVAQEAWRSAFEALQRGEAFPDERDFARFLHKVAANCVGMMRRAAAANKRSLGREEPLAGRDHPAKAPGPAELAASADHWDVFLAGLLPVDRHIVVRCFRGEPLAEIALALGLDLRFVQRLVKRAQLQWMEREWAAR